MGTNKVFSPARVSFDTALDDRDKRKTDPTDEESQLGKTIRPVTAPEVPVSDVLKDITRRSTVFPDEAYMENMRRMANRPISEQMLDDISDSMDICSDGEIEATRDREKVFRRRRSSNFPKGITNGKRMSTTNIDDVDSRLTGHFAPGRCDVDIAKVRSVILNNQVEPRNVTSLYTRLSQQSNLIEQLVAKLDRIENRGKSAFERERSTFIAKKNAQSAERKEMRRTRG